MSTARVKMYWG